MTCNSMSNSFQTYQISSTLKSHLIRYEDEQSGVIYLSTISTPSDLVGDSGAGMSAKTVLKDLQVEAESANSVLFGTTSRGNTVELWS